MKFSAQKPTVPGAYWWQDEDGLMLVHIKASPTGELWAQGTECHEGRVERMGGSWSSRLVPVDQNRSNDDLKIAFIEGASLARHWSHLDPLEIWNNCRSNTRRVVEGREP